MRTYLYLLPDDGLSNAVRGFQRKLSQWNIRNTATEFPPHVTLSGHFDANDEQLEIAKSALAELLAASTLPRTVEVGALCSAGQSLVFLDIDAPAAVNLALRWPSLFEGRCAGVSVYRSSPRLHLTLASGYAPRRHAEVMQEAAMRFATHDEVRWKLGFLGISDNVWRTRAEFPFDVAAPVGS